MTTPNSSTQSALAGIRVLDFTRVLAGPLCTMMLGDLGADVIKIENPGRGDDTRHWGPPWSGEGEQRQSAYFLSVNRNKRSLTLNLKTPQGRDLARQLAQQSHIVVENFRHGLMADFGLGYDDLHALNPALVYCSITGYGQTGPYHERPGYDYVIQAMSGLMSITGPEAGPPYKVGVAIADVLTGLSALSAIQAALLHSQRIGQGQYIDIALLDSQLSALVNIASNYLVSGQSPPRYGNQHASIVPYQTFEASDGAFVLAVGNDKQFALLCDLIDCPGLIEDVRFSTNPARVENRQALIDVLDPILRQKSVRVWVDMLLASGIPAGPINDVATILEDPHVQSRGMVLDTTLPDGTPTRLVGSPLHLSQTPPSLRLAPPMIGQHTDTILHDVLNLDSETIQAYRADGVI